MREEPEKSWKPLSGAKHHHLSISYSQAVHAHARESSKRSYHTIRKQTWSCGCSCCNSSQNNVDRSTLSLLCKNWILTKTQNRTWAHARNSRKLTVVVVGVSVHGGLIFPVSGPVSRSCHYSVENETKFRCSWSNQKSSLESSKTLRDKISNSEKFSESGEIFVSLK